MCCLQHICCRDSVESIRFFIFILPFRQMLIITNQLGKSRNKLMMYLILNGYQQSTSVVDHSQPMAIFLDAGKKKNQHANNQFLCHFFVEVNVQASFRGSTAQKTNANTVSFETVFQGCVQNRGHANSYLSCSQIKSAR